MQVETVDGKTFEGIFSAWSPDLELVLEQAHPVSETNNNNNNGGSAVNGFSIDPASVVEKLVIAAQNIVRCHAVDVDLDFATKGIEFV